MLAHISTLRADSPGSCRPGSSKTSALDDTIDGRERRSARTRALEEGKDTAGGDITDPALDASGDRPSDHTSLSKAGSSQQRCGHETRRGNNGYACGRADG